MALGVIFRPRIINDLVKCDHPHKTLLSRLMTLLRILNCAFAQFYVAHARVDFGRRCKDLDLPPKQNTYVHAHTRTNHIFMCSRVRMSRAVVQMLLVVWFCVGVSVKDVNIIELRI